MDIGSCSDLIYHSAAIRRSLQQGSSPLGRPNIPRLSEDAFQYLGAAARLRQSLERTSPFGRYERNVSMGTPPLYSATEDHSDGTSGAPFRYIGREAVKEVEIESPGRKILSFADFQLGGAVPMVQGFCKDALLGRGSGISGAKSIEGSDSHARTSYSLQTDSEPLHGTEEEEESRFQIYPPHEENCHSALSEPPHGQTPDHVEAHDSQRDRVENTVNQNRCIGGSFEAATTLPLLESPPPTQRPATDILPVRDTSQHSHIAGTLEQSIDRDGAMLTQLCTDSQHSMSMPADRADSMGDDLSALQALLDGENGNPIINDMDALYALLTP